MTSIFHGIHSSHVSLDESAGQSGGAYNPEKTLIDNPDVKFWFVLGPEYSKMPGISKSEPRLDPVFLDVSEKNLKSPTNKTVTSHNQSKKSISPHEVRDSQPKSLSENALTLGPQK